MNDYMFLMQLKRDYLRYSEMLVRYSNKDAEKLIQAIKELLKSYEVLIHKTEIEIGIIN